MTIKERLVRNDKNTPACHSERSEESCVLNRRITLVCHSERSEESCVLHGPIIIKSRIHFHITNPHSRCRDSSSPKSSFRMTIKERLVRNDKNTPACHSERSEESCVLNRRITLVCHSDRSEESSIRIGRILQINRKIFIPEIPIRIVFIYQGFLFNPFPTF